MFSKKVNIILLFTILAIGLLTILEATEPSAINWFPSYAKTDKIPLGTFVTYNLLKESNQIDQIQDVNQPPYEFLNSPDSIQGVYMFINGVINFDEKELNKILTWVEKGNSVFISASTVSKKLLDTLNLENDNLIGTDYLSTQPILNLVNPNLKLEQPIHYPRNIYNTYFSKIDTATTTVLGEMEIFKDTLVFDEPEINFIKHSHGEGEILIHLFPEAFSNHFMLKDQNNKYTENVLAYIPKQKTLIWDNHYKTGKTFNSSPLYLMLNNRYLKWSYYILLLGVLLFILFEGKRKQRSIPVVEPLTNQTIAFTQTISGMYFEKGKHKEIANKQYNLFLAYIRNVLRVPTNTINDKIIKDIASRSDNTEEDTKEIFIFFERLKEKPSITKEELTLLHKKVSTFKKIH